MADTELIAVLREQMAFARGRCAALHELDIEDREVPCASCRQRGLEVYPRPALDAGERERND